MEPIVKISKKDDIIVKKLNKAILYFLTMNFLF